MKTRGLIVLFCFFQSLSFGQVKKIDKLEVLYEQGHYHLVYRKANRLLDIPDYDYSYQPEFYKSLAMFRLSDDKLWSQFHPGALQEARKLFLDVKSSSDGAKVFNAHLDHVAELRKFLVERAEKLKLDGNTTEFDELQEILFGLFEHIPDLDNPNGTITPKDPETNEGEGAESVALVKTREDLITEAKKYIGTPYVWAGEDPAGFDCSGFTQYVYSKNNKTIPRRAEEQYKASVKIKQRNATKGDLVFFNNGSGVSHVGMIISEKGAPLTMIHASSSKGIVITNIEESEYWLKRLYGFGTFVKSAE